jgi:LysR family glycine cleavage system transcriptional activator
MVRLPSLVAIHAFEAAARLGSFAAAARELGTTAASVSYHVRRLEQQMGAVLFHRGPHRVALTEAGRLAAEEASRAFAALKGAFARAAELDESRLSLTTLPTVGATWLTPKLGRFREKHPEVRLELDLSVEAQDLAAGGFDAAIRNGHARWPGLRAEPLIPAIFLPLCTPELKAATAGIADPAHRLDVPLLGRRDWWGLWYRRLGEATPPSAERFGATLSTEHLDVTAALAGQGVAIASPILFRAELDAGRLVPAHDAVCADGRSFWLTWPTARSGSAKIRAFRTWLSDEAAGDRAAAAPFIRRAVTVEG